MPEKRRLAPGHTPRDVHVAERGLGGQVRRVVGAAEVVGVGQERADLDVLDVLVDDPRRVLVEQPVPNVGLEDLAGSSGHTTPTFRGLNDPNADTHA